MIRELVACCDSGRCWMNKKLSLRRRLNPSLLDWPDINGHRSAVVANISGWRKSIRSV
jgi:hypothetical protein